MSGLQKRLLLAVALLLVAQCGINLTKYFFEVSHGGRFGGDFSVFWDTARLLRHGNTHGLYDTGKLQYTLRPHTMDDPVRGPFLYPPPTLFLMWPMRHLSYNDAVGLWSSLSILLYYAMVFLLVRRSFTGNEDAATRRMIYFTTAAPMLPFLSANLFTGQTAAIIGAIFFAIAYFWRKRPVLAGIFAGLMVLKPQLGIVLPLVLIASRQWKTLAVACATALALAAAATCWLGMGIWQEYFTITHMMVGYLKAGVDQFDKLALGPYISLHALRDIGVSMPVAAAAQMAVTAVVAVIIFCIFRVQDGRDDLRFGLLASGSLLATPYTMCYDSPLLGAAIIALVPRLWQNGWQNMLELLAFICVVVMPYAQPLLLAYHVPFAFLSTGLFFAVLVRRYQAQI